jgi:chorismate--pyruvate lyase
VPVFSRPPFAKLINCGSSPATPEEPDLPKAAPPRRAPIPLWRPLHQFPRHQRPTATLQDWLEHSGSLTARLLQLSQGQFAVKIVRQVIGIPALNERKTLRMSRPVRSLIREVILCGRGKPWVFARSVLPLTSLTGSLRHLRQQDTRPLGAFLFSQPQLVRSAIEVAPITLDHGYVPPRLCGEQSLWGRRSVFYLHTKPLLVSEVFLPDFVSYLRDSL